MLELREQDSGVLLRWIVYDDINIANLTTAVVKQVKLTKPDTTSVIKPLSFETDGTDGVVTYLVEPGVLNISGVYTWQLYLEVPPFKGHSDKGELLVESII
jgi:hypothetical protein